MSSEINNGVW